MNRQVLGVLILVLLVLGPYQNCSLHQSEGRKQLELFLTRQGDESCAPYLFVNTLGVYFDPGNQPHQITARKVGSSQCVISAENSVDTTTVPEGVPEAYSCGLTHDPSVSDLTPAGVEAAFGSSPFGSEIFTLAPNANSPTGYIINVATVQNAGTPNQFGFAIERSNGLLDYFFVSKSGQVDFMCQSAGISSTSTFGALSIKSAISMRAGGIAIELDAGLNTF